MQKDTKDTIAGAGIIAAGCGIQLFLTGAAIAIGLWLFSLFAR